jgi:hypothetical protein
MSLPEIPGSGMLNDKFPRPLQSENDEFSSDEAGETVTSFVFADIFPRVVVVSSQGFRVLPPPIDLLMQEGDGNQIYVIEHRRLAYLGKILRSWQRAVIEQQIFPFPLYEDVKKATETTTRNVIEYNHHGLQWRSSYFVSTRTKQKTLIVHLANDGYIYIPDTAMVTTRLETPNDRHPTEPVGWAVFKTARRDAALQELNDFVAFADSWFGVVPYLKTGLYNADARRIDIRFQSKSTGSGGFKTALEFSFERDWPMTDESSWFW